MMTNDEATPVSLGDGPVSQKDSEMSLGDRMMSMTLEDR